MSPHPQSNIKWASSFTNCYGKANKKNACLDTEKHDWTTVSDKEAIEKTFYPHAAVIKIPNWYLIKTQSACSDINVLIEIYQLLLVFSSKSPSVHVSCISDLSFPQQLLNLWKILMYFKIPSVVINSSTQI